MLTSENSMLIAGLIYRDSRLCDPHHVDIITGYKDETEKIYRTVRKEAELLAGTLNEMERDAESVKNSGNPSESRVMSTWAVLKGNRYLFFKARENKSVAVIVNNDRHRIEVNLYPDDLMKIHSQLYRIEDRLLNEKHDLNIERTVKHSIGYDMEKYGDLMFREAEITEPNNIEKLTAIRDIMIESEER